VVDNHFVDWEDAATIGEDGLAALAILFPATAPLDALASVALKLAPVVSALVASGVIRGDADPVHDAQTEEGRGGRRD
jgi:hypothetical protein